MVKESISKNIEKGALQSDYANKYPNLEIGLAVSYAASLAGLHDVSNKAREIAYTQAKINDVPDIEQMSYSFSPTEQSESLNFKNMTDEQFSQYTRNIFANSLNGSELINTAHNNSERLKEEREKNILNEIENSTPAKSVNKKEEISTLEIIEVAADVLTLVPGVDTFANAVSLVINVIQGDWDDAALSAVGMVPVLGEFADAAKTGKLAVKVIDKVHDASKLTKFADKTLDIIKNPKFIEHTGKIGECITNAIITGSVYANDGKSFGVGFASELVSSLVSEYIPVPTKKAHVETIIKESIGSALGAVVDGFINGDDIEALTNSVVKSAAKGIVVGLGVDYLETAIKLANEAGSVAREFSKYDEKFGKALEFFFKRLITAMSATEIKNEN